MNYSEILNSLMFWLSNQGVKIVLIIVIAFLVKHLIKTFLERIIRRAVSDKYYSSPVAEKKREDTLIRIMAGVLNILTLIVAILMILQEVGVNIAPLLAGAGILGVAVGFGAQYLIRDIITGFFMIFENQYRIGDLVSVDNVTGTVENISLRVTTLRDWNGVVHYIPNGEIKKLSNQTRGFSVANVVIGVSYDADIDKVIDIVNKTGEEMYKDENLSKKIKKAPYFLRVDDLADSSVNIRIMAETEPGEQFFIAGEIRRLMKKAFDKQGIEIPFPQRVVHSKKD